MNFKEPGKLVCENLRQALMYAYETRIKRVLLLREAYNRMAMIKNFIVVVFVRRLTTALLFQCRSQQSRKYR